MCKNRDIYGFLGTSWVLTTMAARKIGWLFTHSDWLRGLL